MAIANCRIVLVRPRIPENIGAAARVMRNFGLRDLVLVAPETDIEDRQARKLSTQGETILDQARTVAELTEALGDCRLVVGTTARTGGLFRPAAVVGTPDAIALKIAVACAAGPTALVFGPERTGLTNAEVALCQHLICIPTHADYPVLNLAQAVAICVYKVARAVNTVATNAQPTEPEGAGFAEQQAMFDHLRRGLEAIHFLHGPDADALFVALRRMIVRAEPSAAEINILRGLARQLEWVARHDAK